MSFTEHNYTIRAFLAEEVAAYKAIRLEALRQEPGMFGSNYAREAVFTDAQWMERIMNPIATCLGLYYNDELIGITGIMLEPSHPGTAQMTQSYIRLAFRGKGLAKMLYKARLEWAKAKGVRRIVVGHRADNIPSNKTTRHFGFQFTHREPHEWPAGDREDILYYELKV
jgi:RimJ/RimL family protein N-acetyltransferase